jgi:hypothetical protein
MPLPLPTGRVLSLGGKPGGGLLVGPHPPFLPPRAPPGGPHGAPPLFGGAPPAVAPGVGLPHPHHPPPQQQQGAPTQVQGGLSPPGQQEKFDVAAFLSSVE